MGKNNPLNIRYSGFNHWLGQCGESKGFCVFDSMDYGLRAGLVLLCRTYRWKGYINIRQILGRFAPPSENDTDKYIEYVSCKSGIPREKFLSTIKEYAHVLSAMCYFESRTIVSFNEILRVAREFGIQLKKLH